jgi:hypothetical protein
MVGTVRVTVQVVFRDWNLSVPKNVTIFFEHVHIRRAFSPDLIPMSASPQFVLIGENSSAGWRTIPYEFAVVYRRPVAPYDCGISSFVAGRIDSLHILPKVKADLPLRLNL